MNAGENSFQQTLKRILLVAPALIFCYVAIRAAFIDITHDEAYSFYNMKKFWYAEALCTGNTHWLNSAAIKLAILLNLENLAAIRWLSIFSALIICVIIYKWLKISDSLTDRLILFSVLLCNPYILDYLSIARGYAAGLMLEFLSLFFLVKAIETNNRKLQFLCILFAGLSPIANFSYIYFFFSFCIVYFFRFHFSQKQFFRSKFFYRDIFFALAIGGIVARAFLFMTRCSNDVVGAGSNDPAEFFQVFSDAFVYLKWNISTTALSLTGFAIYLFALISAIYGVYRKSINSSLYFYSSLLFLLITAIIFFNHFAFHLVYPYYRSAVFLFPVSAITVLGFMRKISVRFKPLSLAVAVLLIVNLIFSANFKWVLDFRIQSDLRASMNYTESLNAKHVGISPELYGGFRNYYQMTWKNYYDFFGEPINTNLPKGISKDTVALKRFDYLILFPPYDLSFYRNSKIRLKGLILFPESRTLVAKVLK